MSNCDGKELVSKINTEPKKLVQENGENGNKNGCHKEKDCQNTSKDDTFKQTEYIPSEIVSFVPSSGTNTVSNGPSGQPCTLSSEANKGTTDSKKYHDSKALYDAAKDNESEGDSMPKKRKIDKEHIEANLSDSISITNENTDLVSGKSKSSDKARSEEEMEEEKCGVSGSDKSELYIPSEYGSFQATGCVSTFTKSKTSGTEKNLTQSTNTPNSKGGISHEDKKDE